MISHCLHLEFHLVNRGIYLIQSRRNNILITQPQRCCCFFMCVPRLCFWTNLILHCLHLHSHFAIPLKQSRRKNDLTTLLRRFCFFFMRVPRFCFWTNLISRFLHLRLHFDIKGEISLKQSRRNNNLTTLLWRSFCLSMCVLRLCFLMNLILHCLHLDFHLFT